MHFSGKDTLKGLNRAEDEGGDALHPFKTKNNLENF